MSTPWSSLTVRFRPDQVTKYQELYPEKPFAPTMRMLLDTFLDGKKSTPRRLEEVRKLRDKIAKQLVMLELEEAELVKDEHMIIIQESLDKMREEFLQKNPDLVDQYHKNNISTKGYQTLQVQLKFTSIANVKQFLAKHNGMKDRAESTALVETP